MRFRIFTDEQAKIIGEELQHIIAENTTRKAVRLEERFRIHQTKTSQKGNPNPQVNNQPL